ncbi:MAG TPA: glycosyltransferase family 2 protein [Acidobacteriaceae bacterium]|nr:glycosyltransferase family 2 protein [Acidobacteriaceae bacterium]
MSSRISVIIPALNEQESIGYVVSSLPRDVISECIVVDNGSTDRTAETAVRAGARVINSPRGFGAAMYAGSHAAVPTSDILVFLDGDGSDDVADMTRLLGPVERGEADFVLGSRIRGQRERGSMLGSQVFAGHLIGFLVRLFYGFRYTDMGPFRVIRRECLERMQMTEMTYGWNLEMQIKAIHGGLRILEVPVNYRRRIGGKSKVSGDLTASIKAALRIFSVLFRARRRGRG